MFAGAYDTGGGASFSAESLKRDFSKFTKKAKIHGKPCKSNDSQGFFFDMHFQYFQNRTKVLWRTRGAGQNGMHTFSATNS